VAFFEKNKDMARGKTRSKRPMSSQDQERLIKKMEDQTRTRTKDAQIKALGSAQAIKKNYLNELPATSQLTKGEANEIDMADGTTYKGVDVLSKYTVSDLRKAMQIPLVDMSNDLVGLDADNMFLRFATHCDEESPSFRIYMRSETNFVLFAMLQRCIEKVYQINPQECLQGWIMHYGCLFIFGGANFSLQEAMYRINESIQEVWTELMIDKAGGLTIS